MPGRILLVEDDDKARELMKEVLLESGHKVVEAQNGEEGLELVLRERPHLVVSDVVMPKMDGMELCRRLKRKWSTRYIPLVFLTSEARVTDMMEGFEIGADEYITKPFSPKELALRVDQVLNRSASRLDPVTRLPGYFVTELELAKVLRHVSEYLILGISITLEDFVKHPGIEELLGLLGEGAWKTLSQLDKDPFVGRYDLFRFVGIAKGCNLAIFQQNLQKVYDRVVPLALRGCPKDKLPQLKICSLPQKDSETFSIYHFKAWIEHQLNTR